MKLTLSLFITSILFTTVGLLTSCQPTEYEVFGDIHGQVLQNDNNQAVEGAMVTLSPGGKTYLTDGNGTFTFNDLEIQQYTLTVQKDRFTTNRKTVTPIVGQSVEAVIFLSPQK